MPLAMTMAVDNFAVGDRGHQHLVAAIGRTPSIGTFDIVITFLGARGAKLWLLALDGEKSSGSRFLAQLNCSAMTSPAPTTVGPGRDAIGPGSLLLASTGDRAEHHPDQLDWDRLRRGRAATGLYSGSNFLTLTGRYRLNAPASVNTVSATFAASRHRHRRLADRDPGRGDGQRGCQWRHCVRTVDHGHGRRSQASRQPELPTPAIAQAKSTWSEILLLQPDAAGVDRRIFTAGPAAAPNYMLDMVQTGAAAANVYRWRYRLADGVVAVETGPGTQSTAAHVIALVHQPGDPVAYVNGIESVSNRTGNLRIGVLDFGAGGMAIGGHDQASPAPYSGLIGRYLVYDGALSRRADTAADQVAAGSGLALGLRFGE